MAESSEHNLILKRSKSEKSFMITPQEVLNAPSFKPKNDKTTSVHAFTLNSPDLVKNLKNENGTIKDTSIAKLILKSNLSKVKRKIHLQLPERKVKNEDVNPFIGILSDDSIEKGNMSEEKIGLESEKIYKDHLKQTFIALKAVRNLKKIPKEKILDKKLNLVKSFQHEGRKTVIFDLDETLVHCVGMNRGHVALPVKFPNGKSCLAGVNIRPYAKECLEVASKLFEVIVFTASHKCYADVIIDYLDPQHKFIHHRLYREHCVQINSVNVKDLRIINRRIQDIVIIDNSVFSFAFHLDNGVPIITWMKNPYDKELYSLIPYFNVIADAEDVREINRSLFHLDTYCEDFCNEYNDV